MSTIALVRIGAMIGKRGIWKDRRIKVDGRYKYTLEQLTSPFEISFLYVRADYKPLFAFYAAEYKPSDELITESAEDYIKYLDNL